MKAEEFWSLVDKRGPDECWPWLGGLRDKESGYGQARFEGRNRGSHRVAFRLTYGRYPLPLGRHSCDNPPCCNPTHVLEGTSADNMRDAAERGRTHQGERNPFARLTEADVRAIRADERAKALIAEAYGVHVKHVERIRARRSWRHVQ